MRKTVFIMVILSTVAVSHFSFARSRGRSNEGVRGIAGSILSNIIAGMENDDYQQYSKDFDDIMKSSITGRQIQSASRKLGKHRSHKHLGFLDQGGMIVVLWKARFRSVKDDVLIKLVLLERNEKYYVTGLWFQ